MKKFYLVCSILLLLCSSSFALLFEPPNLLEVNGIQFALNLNGDIRISELDYQNLSFNVSGTATADSAVIVWTSPQLDLSLSILPREQFYSSAMRFSLRADFKQELLLHELYLTMDGVDTPVQAALTGVQAIESGDPYKNIDIMPFTDKVAQYSTGEGSFWIVASNYAECEGVEDLSSNRIELYDYKGHFFRKFNTVTSATDLMRNAMFQTAGATFDWSFLLFTEKPFLLDINRWQGNNRAALCITSDADGETLERLKAVFEGSNNPANPKYYTKGFFARDIPVTSTVFGNNRVNLGAMWTAIQEHGNTIGYHTYAGGTDPPGMNQQALLTDLVPYNIRTWIDHSVPNNPEDICYNGLDPASPNYVADIINQSTIDYVWGGDTPYTNPFNAFEEAWRLPHIVYEASQFNRPIWFYGRTRMEYWEYHNQYNMLCMKYLMTADNLDRLIADRGLVIAYTHLCGAQSTTANAYYVIAPNGDYEVRDEVDDMLQMLDYYRDERGLWIAPSETIFDRMLATEQVSLVSVQKTADSHVYCLKLHNGSQMDISDLSLHYKDLTLNIPLFAAGSDYNFYIYNTPDSTASIPARYFLRYAQGELVLKNAYEHALEPLQISIYNLRGQKVFSSVLTSSQDSFNVPITHIASGIYFARITPNSGKSSVVRFTVLK